MPDTLTTITKFINSPPGQLAAGGVLAGIVWKFFKNIGDVLNETTNREIAAWLNDLSATKLFQSALVAYVDAIFLRSYRTRGALLGSLATYSIISFSGGVAAVITFRPFDRAFRSLAVNPAGKTTHEAVLVLQYSAVILLLGLGIMGVDVLQRRLKKEMSFAAVLGWIVKTVLQCFVMILVPYIALITHVRPTDTFLHLVEEAALTFPFGSMTLAMTVTLAWLWLYAGSGFMLKAARRFDIGFEWFNRHFDIEKKPLQCIGLVAGAMVALVYWVAVIVSRVVG